MTSESTTHANPAPSAEPMSESREATVHVPSPAAGWPGLIFWLGGGVWRTLGYFALVLAGICIARKDSLAVLLFELLLGHVLICAAEVIDKMNEERKCDSSANNRDVPTRT